MKNITKEKRKRIDEYIGFFAGAKNKKIVETLVESGTQFKSNSHVMEVALEEFFIKRGLK